MKQLTTGQHDKWSHKAQWKQMEKLREGVCGQAEERGEFHLGLNWLARISLMVGWGRHLDKKSGSRGGVEALSERLVAPCSQREASQRAVGMGQGRACEPREGSKLSDRPLEASEG